MKRCGWAATGGAKTTEGRGEEEGVGWKGEGFFCERLLEMARKISCFVIDIRKSSDLACYWAYHLF
jgi:hypothetical protein